jgi:F1F0 ATPase subunit 2
MDASAMIALHLNDALITLARPLGWLAAGVFIGWLYFLSLWWNVRRIADAESPRVASAIQLVRFGLVGGAFAMVAALFGAMPLMAMTAGLMVARAFIIHAGAQP